MNLNFGKWILRHMGGLSVYLGNRITAAHLITGLVGLALLLALISIYMEATG